MALATRMIFDVIRKATFQTVCKSTLASSLKKMDVIVFKDEDNSLYKIKLGDSILKTPGKKHLAVPDESLALAIANEWRSEKKKKKVNLTNMHLTTLAYTAIDNPFEETNEDVAQEVIEYLKFDTIRFRDVENEDLLHRQSRHWDPLIEWFEHTHNCLVPIDYGVFSGSGTIPVATTDTIQRLMSSHGRWPLVGLVYIARNLKSFILASCLMERFLKVETAVELARLEIRFQTEKWSKVEWEHDIDEQCTNARVAAGTLFYHLTV